MARSPNAADFQSHWYTDFYVMLWQITFSQNLPLAMSAIPHFRVCLPPIQTLSQRYVQAPGQCEQFEAVRWDLKI